jgi:hypothetical protein
MSVPIRHHQLNRLLPNMVSISYVRSRWRFLMYLLTSRQYESRYRERNDRRSDKNRRRCVQASHQVLSAIFNLLK